MKERFTHYLANLALIWFAILLYRYNTYYVEFLSEKTQVTLLILAIAYTCLGLLYYLIVPIVTENKGMNIARLLKRLSREVKAYLNDFVHDHKKPLPVMSAKEKTNLLFLLVKLFFLPIMINFFWGNLDSFLSLWNQIKDVTTLFTMNGFSLIFYPLLIALIFVLDTLWFSFGYAFESKTLKNQVRSVEPTAFGWVVALLTYPPFSNITSYYVLWYAYDSTPYPTDTLTFASRVLLTLLFLTYLAATFALGAKCSNLTNRGIVSRGPYRYVRHPAYIAKNLAWWVMVIPIFSWKVALATAIWSLLYYFRAITEERHLIKDPDYQAYVKKVKWRFIPGIH